MTTAKQRAAEARRIANKWVKRIGLGFHPDTRGEDYTPPFSKAEAAEYDDDMETLFLLAADPYEVAVEAMQKADDRLPLQLLRHKRGA